MLTRPSTALAELRELYNGVNDTQMSVEAWKFALWATIGFNMNTMIAERQQSHPAEALQTSTAHVRRQFYEFKGPDFVMENRHHTFMGRTSRLGIVLKVYGYAIFFDEDCLWSKMYKLNAEDMRVIQCAKEGRFTEQWIDCMTDAPTGQLNDLVDRYLFDSTPLELK